MISDSLKTYEFRALCRLYTSTMLSKYCKSLEFCVGFVSQISHMNCFLEIKYHRNILAVHCDNVTNAKSAKLNSNEITFMGKTAKYKAFTVV